MKRYQCIKNVIDVDYKGKSYISFKAGVIYDMNDDGDLVDNLGFTALFLKSELEIHFQELLDLHVDDIPRDEADREPFTTPEPRRKLTAGWAWFIVLVITIGFFVLKAFTE